MSDYLGVRPLVSHLSLLSYLIHKEGMTNSILVLLYKLKQGANLILQFIYKNKDRILSAVKKCTEES